VFFSIVQNDYTLIMSWRKICAFFWWKIYPLSQNWINDGKVKQIWLEQIEDWTENYCICLSCSYIATTVCH